MALRGITDTVNTFNNGIHRCIITNRTIRAVEIIVDSSRQTNTTNVILFSKFHCTCQRAIATNHNQGINIFFHNIFISLGTSFNGRKVCRARRLQDSSPFTDNTAHILGRKVYDFIINETIIPTIYSLNLETIVNSGARHRTNSCIHSWRVTTRSKYANCFNLCHYRISFILIIVCASALAFHNAFIGAKITIILNTAKMNDNSI